MHGKLVIASVLVLVGHLGGHHAGPNLHPNVRVSIQGVEGVSCVGAGHPLHLLLEHALVGGSQLRMKTWIECSFLSVNNISTVKVLWYCGDSTHCWNEPVDPPPFLLHVADPGHLPLSLHGEGGCCSLVWGKMAPLLEGKVVGWAAFS